jgi:hypothetical protein
MATKKIKRGRAYFPPVWAETPGERLEWVLSRRAILIMPAYDWPTNPRLVVQIASEGKVDARWLAVGVPSRAGVAAAKHFCDSSHDPGGAYDLYTRQAEEIERLLVVTPEPDLGTGVCRYCLCTDAAGCAHGEGGSCWWVDGAATICSACLEPGDE